MWDWQTRTPCLKQRAPHLGGGLGFSPDGHRLAFVGRTGALEVYELPAEGPGEGRLRTQWKGSDRSGPVSFSPEGLRLATCRRADGGLVEIVNLEGVTLAQLPHSGAVNGLAWHPDGRLLLTACQDQNAYLWDAGNGKLNLVLHGHQGWVIQVCCGAGGDLVASTSCDGSTRLWSPWTGRELVCGRGGGRVFSADDRWLAFNAADAHGRFEVATARECRTPHGYDLETEVWGLDYSRDGRLLASAALAGVRLWDVHTARLIR